MLRLVYITPFIIAFFGCSRGTESTGLPQVAATLSAEKLFEMRGKCTGFANSFEDRRRREWGRSSTTLVQFVSRYDPAANRCFVEIYGFDGASHLRQVFDAQEQRLMVECIQNEKEDLPPCVITESGLSAKKKQSN